MALAPKSCHKECFENSSYRTTKLSHMSAPQSSHDPNDQELFQRGWCVDSRPARRNARMQACSRGRMAFSWGQPRVKHPLPSWRRIIILICEARGRVQGFQGEPPSLSAIVCYLTLTGWVHRSPMNHLMQSHCHKTTLKIVLTNINRIWNTTQTKKKTAWA